MTAATRKPSTPQVEALRLVSAGRVTYGEPYPKRAARAHTRLAGTAARDISGAPVTLPTRLVAYVNPVFLLDGAEVYGGQHSTFGSLSERGLIVSEGLDCVGIDTDDPLRARLVVLTPAGRAALAAHPEETP